MANKTIFKSFSTTGITQEIDYIKQKEIDLSKFIRMAIIEKIEKDFNKKFKSKEYYKHTNNTQKGVAE
ncbi:MAG: hypothetical protein PHD37_10795 [Gallionellaceae bacterium]|nr:hypothetical protein [Gallionellaceae bacterium]